MYHSIGGIYNRNLSNDPVYTIVSKIRKAEKETQHKAQKHVKYRKKDWYVAAFCVSSIIGKSKIYF